MHLSGISAITSMQSPITTRPKKGEQGAAWNPCPAGSFSEVNVDGGQ
jgi:hypothetical protein